jgi:hypothetical protein
MAATSEDFERSRAKGQMTEDGGPIVMRTESTHGCNLVARCLAVETCPIQGDLFAIRRKHAAILVGEWRMCYNRNLCKYIGIKKLPEL